MYVTCTYIHTARFTLQTYFYVGCEGTIEYISFHHRHPKKTIKLSSIYQNQDDCQSIIDKSENTPGMF